MSENRPNQAPDRFIRLIKKAMDEHPEKPSLNEVARRADLSPAYLSFLLNGKRRAPSREAIAQLAHTLSIPEDDLFAAAGKSYDLAPEFFRKEEAAPIVRTLAKIPAHRLPAVHKYLVNLLRNQKANKPK